VSPAEALISFTAAAAVMAMVPGLDTALILRAAAVEGPKRAMLATAGVVLGCLAWGAAVAVGLGALLAASQTAFTALKWAGAAYLAWLGLNLIFRPRARFDAEAGGAMTRGGDFTWMRRGFLGNLLNPKVGVFYVSFLPQFLPQGVEPGPFIFLLATIHASLGLIWFAALISATRPIMGVLRRSAAVRWLDRITGGIFLGFAARLALEKA
jgi:threonine/homoserine/homoserine lactone efflux protein